MVLAYWEWSVAVGGEQLPIGELRGLQVATGFRSQGRELIITGIRIVL